MRAVVQRVTSSKVSVDGKTVGEIGKGFNVLLGVVEGDTDEQTILLAGKIARLRDEANRLYELFCSELSANGVRNVEKGIFGADMAVDIANDGPVTIMLDTDIWRKDK